MVSIGLAWSRSAGSKGLKKVWSVAKGVVAGGILGEQLVRVVARDVGRRHVYGRKLCWVERIVRDVHLDNCVLYGKTRLFGAVYPVRRVCHGRWHMVT
jgi:hypothetical protein